MAPNSPARIDPAPLGTGPLDAARMDTSMHLRVRRHLAREHYIWSMFLPDHRIADEWWGEYWRCQGELARREFRSYGNGFA